MKREALWLTGAACALLWSAAASAQTSRTEVLTRAYSYAHHRWTATDENISQSRCPENFNWYQGATYSQVRPHYVGDFVGLPYNWGGYMTLRTFDERIANRYGAGAAAGTNLESPDCTAGVDCSGFVSQCWGVGHNTTSSIPNISVQIAANEMLPGDVWNRAGLHVDMLSRRMASGNPEIVESLGYNVNINRSGGLGGHQGFVPRRHQNLSLTEPSVPSQGTLQNPVAITLPNFTHAGSTVGWPSSVYAKYSCDSSKLQEGPEVVYQVTFDEPGTFTASLSNDAGGDVDVILLSQLNTSDCVARHDRAVTAQVGCGTYYVVVDTFGAKASARPTAYTLTTTFTRSSGVSCQSATGPRPFEPQGAPGDRCASQATPNEPAFCDINLGAETCLSTSDDSFCTHACAVDNDCGDMPGGGCCGPVTVSQGGQQRTEYYCYAAALCEGGGTSGSSSGGPGSSSGTSGSSGASGANGSGGAPGSSSGTSGSSGASGTNGGGVPDGFGADGDGEEQGASGGCGVAPTSAPGAAALVGALACWLGRRRRAAR